MYIQFDFQSDTPLYQQLRNQIVVAISTGELKSGDKLPAVRALADESGINAMTISKAYQLLKKEGYITSSRRSGTVVCSHNAEVIPDNEVLSRLQLCISELRLSGMSEEEVLSICRNYMKGIQNGTEDHTVGQHHLASSVSVLCPEK